MAKIQLDVPSELHAEVKRLQIERELENDRKENLKDLYYEVVRAGVEKLKAERKV